MLLTRNDKHHLLLNNFCYKRMKLTINSTTQPLLVEKKYAYPQSVTANVHLRDRLKRLHPQKISSQTKTTHDKKELQKPIKYYLENQLLQITTATRTTGFEPRTSLLRSTCPND